MDRIYISALHNTPVQQAANHHIASLLDSYGFDAYLHDENKDADTVLAIDLSRLMVVIFHEPEFTPQMTLEMERARQRAIPVIGLYPPDVTITEDIATCCIRMIPLPEDEQELIHPLMTSINRYFPV